MVPGQSEAIPAFARQVGMPCKACHFQHFPKLNAFGRAFKLGGFTDIGSEEQIEDEDIHIPVVLNAAYMNKIGYNLTSANPTAYPIGQIKVGTDRGALQLQEASLFVGGRVGEFAGSIVELGIGGAAATMGGQKLVFSYPVSFGRAGATIFNTGGLGVGYGLELFNTGVVGNHRGFDNQHLYAPGLLGWSQGGGTASNGNAGAVTANAATGVGIFAGSDLFFAQVAAWGPANLAAGDINAGTSLSIYYRLAFTPEVAGWQTMIGLYGTSGTTKLGVGAGANGATAPAVATATTDIKTRFFGVDGQAQGEIAGYSTEFTAAYANAGTNSLGTAIDPYNWGTAFHINGEVAITHGFGLRLGYASRNLRDRVTGGNTKAGDFTVTSIGGYYELAQNVELAPEYSWYNGNGTTGLNGRPYKNMLNVFLEALF
jgi:hypothetical protein